MFKKLLFLLVPVLLLSLLVQLALAPINTVTADTTDPSPYESSRIWMAHHYFYECADNGGFKGSVDRQEIEQGDVFRNGAVDSTGHVFQGETRERSGSIRCFRDANTYETILAISGLTGAELFIDTGYYEVNSDGTYSLKTGVDADVITRAFQDKYSFNFSSPAPSAQRYFMLLSAFTGGCEPRNAADGESGGTSISYVDSSTGETTRRSQFFSSGATNIGAGHNSSVMTCSDIVSQLNNLADAASSATQTWRENNPDATVPGEGSFGSDEDREPTCEDAGGMSWIFCQILGVGSQALNFIDEQMVGILSIDEGFFKEHTGLRDAWVIMRNIAYMLLVPTMLVMIISTALGFDFVSAYTIKSALPRMVAATIFIALSYEITTFLVNFVQVIGYGVHNILLYPFSGPPYGLDSTTTLFDIIPRPSQLAATGGVGLMAWGAYAAVSGVVGGGLIATLAGFAGVAALMLLFVFALLLFRQTLIIMLVLISPLAILAWIFPGRTNIWSLWNKTFWLMMWFFPIIMMTTAVGKIMAVLVANL